MNHLRACVSFSGALLLAAVLSALPAHAQDNAWRATPPPGKALVFVFRSEREPVAARVPVLVNLEPAGELESETFTIMTVSPGRTRVRVGDLVLTSISLEAAANQSYFVWIEALAGVTPVRTDVRVVSESEGRRLIAKKRFVGAAPAAKADVPLPRPPSSESTVAPPPPTIVAAPPARQPAVVRPTPTPTVSGRASDFALIASIGSFKLANQSQTVGGLASTYDTSSKSVFSIEAEWRNKEGLALGGEVFSYKHELVANGTALTAQQEVLALMLNGKYYFSAASGFYPFVGAGIGSASASFSGNLSGTTTGLAYQVLAGAEFRFKNAGLHVQYKSLASTTGDSEKIKAGGSGILAGVSILF